MEITGTFIKQLETKTGTGKNGNWEATSFMIEVVGQYPKKPVFELFNNTDAIAGLTQGQSVTVSFDLDSSEWNGKVFPKVKAFKVVRGQQTTQPAAFEQPQASRTAPAEGDSSDLPF